MNITMGVSSISMNMSRNFTGKRDVASGRQNINFGVYLSDRDHLDLETGEVFENSVYSRIRGNTAKLISAQLSIYRGSTKSDYKENKMRYLGGIESDFYNSEASIEFTCFLMESDFNELIENIRNGHTPSEVVVDLAHNLREKTTLEFGWEPDGSGMKWNNVDKKNRTVKIEEISFGYQVLKENYNENSELILSESQVSEADYRTKVLQTMTSLNNFQVELKKNARNIIIVLLVIYVLGFVFGKFF